MLPTRCVLVVVYQVSVGETPHLQDVFRALANDPDRDRANSSELQAVRYIGST